MKLGYASASLGWMMITSSLRCTCCAKVEITEPYVYDAKTDAIFQDALAVHAGNNERLRKAGKPEKKPFQEVAALKYLLSLRAQVRMPQVGYRQW